MYMLVFTLKHWLVVIVGFHLLLVTVVFRGHVPLIPCTKSGHAASNLEGNPLAQQTVDTAPWARAIFVISSGAGTGTGYLAKLLRQAKGVHAFHEPSPTMSGKWLEMTNRSPYADTFDARLEEKIGAIERYMADHGLREKGEVYAETSHMFLKTFWDVVLGNYDWDIDIVVLRRFLPSVICSCERQNITEPKTWAEYYNTTSSIHAIHRPSLESDDFSDWPAEWTDGPKQVSHLKKVYLSPSGELIRYLVDTEERTQRFIELFENLSNVQITEVRLEEIVTQEGALELFRKLRLTPATDFSLPKDKELERDRKLSKSALEECKRKLFEYLASLPVPHVPDLSKSISALPSLASNKIVLVSQVRNIESSAHTWMRIIGKFADSFVFFDNDSTDRTAEILSMYPNVSVFVRKQVFGHGGEWVEGPVYNKLLEAALAQNATHIVFIDSDEIPTATFAKNNLLRQMLIALVPGEYIMMPLVHLWNGTATHVLKMPHWRHATTLKGFFAPLPGSSYPNDAVHHLRRVPTLTRSGKQYKGYTLKHTNYGSIHFKFANYWTFLVKTDWYMCLGAIQRTYQSIEQLNTIHKARDPLHHLRASPFRASKYRRPVDPQWLEAYRADPAVDLTSFFVDAISEFRIADLKRWMVEYGEEYFAGLDLYGVWRAK